MDNKIVRVTKAQKLEVLKGMIPEESTHTFPGDDKRGAYVFDYNAIMDFFDSELALLAKKNSKERGQTAVQKQNEELKEKVLQYLEIVEITDDHPGATCTEMYKNIPELEEFSSQKASALCRDLKTRGLVVSKEKKGRTYFSLA